MNDYRMQIAEAVREACYEVVRIQDMRCDALVAIDDINLQSVIASIPAPEPYCWKITGRADVEWSEEAAKRLAEYASTSKEYIPLYVAPPPDEPVNQQLLDALKDLCLVIEIQKCTTTTAAWVELGAAKGAISAAEQYPSKDFFAVHGDQHFIPHERQAQPTTNDLLIDGEISSKAQPEPLTNEEIKRHWSGGACPDWAIKFARAILSAAEAKRGA